MELDEHEGHSRERALARHQSPQQGRCLRPGYWGGWRWASDGERVGESRFCRKVTGGPHAPEAVTCSATLATRPRIYLDIFSGRESGDNCFDNYVNGGIGGSTTSLPSVPV